MKIRFFSKKEVGCLMMDLDIPTWDGILSNIDSKDLDESEDNPLEKTPHITILYGLIDSELKLDELVEDTKYLYHDFQIRLHNISLFEKEDQDVLKFEVDDSLNVFAELNKFYRANYSYANEFPEYKPHCTIAYLKKGTGKKYLDMMNELLCTSKCMVYSDKDRVKTIID